MKRLFFLFGMLIYSACSGADQVAYVLDFTTQPDGNALPWLKKQGFESKLGFENLDPRFKSGALWLSTQKPEVGICGLIFPKGKDLQQVKRIRLTWGLATAPGGADFERGVNRMALGVMISFGHERLPSGLPLGMYPETYFLCPFLGAKEPDQKVYTGQYWKAGGRYVCMKCGKPGAPTVTDFAVDPVFQSVFKKSPTPPISAVSIQMNTKDTDGKASAFIKKIEFLR